MMKVRSKVYIKEPYDDYAIDDVLDAFVEADLIYDSKYVAFYGTPERLQEMIRAIKTVATVEKIV